LGEFGIRRVQRERKQRDCEFARVLEFEIENLRIRERQRERIDIDDGKMSEIAMRVRSRQELTKHARYCFTTYVGFVTGKNGLHDGRHHRSDRFTGHTDHTGNEGGNRQEHIAVPSPL
jgi:hypothetical protein